LEGAPYVKGSWSSDDFVAGGFWVDDFIGIGQGRELGALATRMGDKYGITGLGEAKWVLGMLIERDRDDRAIYISQEAFINAVVTRLNLTDAAPVSTPLATGSFLSAANCPTTQGEKTRWLDDLT
jgi:hypothetical protein